MDEVKVFGTFEEMLDEIESATQAAIGRMTPEQWRLCDGEAHYAFYIDGLAYNDPQVAVCQVRSRTQFISDQLKYVDADTWGEDSESLDEACYAINVQYGEDGNVSRGYLPCLTWDPVYYRWPDKPDLHDRHASILLEITQEDFEFIQAVQCGLDALRSEPHFLDLLNDYIDLLRAQAGMEVLPRDHGA
jgi:hypothetical protein